MYLYQKNQTFFAQVADGLQDLALPELQHLGARNVEPRYRGIRFQADQSALYAINYQSRLVTRVLAPLISFVCRDRRALYREAQQIEWPTLFNLKQTFGIRANVSGNANLRHSKFAALVLKDAIVDQFRAATGKRPNVDTIHPDIWIHLFIDKQNATISFDTSGHSLHKRGYRKRRVTAPLMETLAAAMLGYAAWHGERPLYDPMCGAATLLCEAWMVACNIPAGFLSSTFGFRHLPDFNPSTWARVKAAADNRIKRRGSRPVRGSDLDRKAVKAARTNCRALPGGAQIAIQTQDFRALGPLADHVIVCNPPYGVRLDTDQDLSLFYRQLGDFLKRQCKGSDAYIFFGNRDMIKCIGLKPSWKKPVRNAGLDGRIVKYALY